ncbi:hypothetical protein SNOG_12922 [Parastagonospora nodorum SN15]|uniref:Uncharacterized protein n=1 Tax=Phaeosphaeria nodorum (strain SN15 / ATCC MYA-4574 / FGSC 10173) TaxID=321614 RepID=Q0U5P2_PHANO|nr:hypothetical protein SNOG_12922 [Parastagonospora nodorum SN15]EAT79722.1 hypothetical protein SNOG_12922 [Parastagonospora nodorum SN15]
MMVLKHPSVYVHVVGRRRSQTTRDTYCVPVKREHAVHSHYKHRTTNTAPNLDVTPVAPLYGSSSRSQGDISIPKSSAGRGRRNEKERSSYRTTLRA